MDQNKTRVDYIINLTPHVIRIYDDKTRIDPLRDKPLLTIKPERVEARSRSRNIPTGFIMKGGVSIPTGIKIHTEVTNLPREQWGTIYIVSHLVASQMAGRKDLYVVLDRVVDSQNGVVGCRKLGQLP
ncbi:MAG: hypothetical protein DRJ64_08220 [Thermoprotei archaeon]|nr:MAG: hypothetical protein DRJ64_08220 [Thermoprotei archaeon]